MGESKKNAPTQAKRFKEKARELGCDEDEKHFERTLKRVSTPKKEKPTN